MLALKAATIAAEVKAGTDILARTTTTTTPTKKLQLIQLQQQQQNQEIVK